VLVGERALLLTEVLDFTAGHPHDCSTAPEHRRGADGKHGGDDGGIGFVSFGCHSVTFQ
jgi:hypothetical protein